jgi:hypothetical protein
LSREIHDGGTGESHSQEHRNIDAEDYLGEADGGFAAANPGSAHDWLARVLGDFSALVGLVLHAPLADLFAKGQSGKLPATSNAICHGSKKAYQELGIAGEEWNEKQAGWLFHGKAKASSVAGRSEVSRKRI